MLIQLELEAFNAQDMEYKATLKPDMVNGLAVPTNNLRRMSNLLTEEEVPDWLKDLLRTEKDHQPAPAGRGMRITKKINYQELFEYDNEEDMENETKGTFQQPIEEE